MPIDKIHWRMYAILALILLIYNNTKTVKVLRMAVGSKIFYVFNISIFVILK